MRFALVVSFACLLAACSSCKESVRTTQPKNSPSANAERDANIGRNQEWVDEENELIEAFIKRRGWDMIATQTGLRYMVYEPGADGPVGKAGQSASVSYKISLLDGTRCYEASADDPKNFVIGFDQVESGIHEVMTYLRAGDKARVILPAHLAFGLTGDNDKIPPLSTVVYDLHILALR